MDGRHIFKDSLDSIIAKVKKKLNQKERERYVAAISYSMTLFVLFFFFMAVYWTEILIY